MNDRLARPGRLPPIAASTTARAPAPPPPRDATLRDVSQLAGVSRMTVTRVLAHPDQVLPGTRAKVQQALVQLGYLPDRAAGGLATRRSGFVGLVLPTLVNGNFASLAEGLTEALRPAGYELLIGYTAYSLAEEERQVRTMLSRRPEALVLAASAHSRTVLRLLGHAGAPVIEIAELSEPPDGRAIGFSNHAVGQAAGRFLRGLGLRRLAAIGPRQGADRHDTRARARLQGFAAALREAGMPTDLVRADGEIPFSFHQGAAAMAALLDAAPDVDGVFAVSDLAAVGALMECRRRAVAVPERLSVLGFGDFEIGQQMVPPLSTIGVDFEGLGRCCATMVIELLRHDNAAREQRVDVGFTLIPRGSTRAGPV